MNLQTLLDILRSCCEQAANDLGELADKARARGDHPTTELLSDLAGLVRGLRDDLVDPTPAPAPAPSLQSLKPPPPEAHVGEPDGPTPEQWKNMTPAQQRKHVTDWDKKHNKHAS